MGQMSPEGAMPSDRSWTQKDRPSVTPPSRGPQSHHVPDTEGGWWAPGAGRGWGPDRGQTFGLGEWESPGDGGWEWLPAG